MKKEKNNNQIKGKIECWSRVPFILSGKFGALNEGSTVSFLVKELSFKSIYKEINPNKFVLEINDVTQRFAISKIENKEKIEKGTLEALLCGYLHEVLAKSTKEYTGFKMKITSKIFITNGVETNFLVNLILSTYKHYGVEYRNEDVCDTICKILREYYGKVVSINSVLALFHSDITRFDNDGDVIKKEKLENPDRFAYVLFYNGPKLTLDGYNEFYNKILNVYDRVKEVFHVNLLRKVTKEQRFQYLYNQISPLTDAEKLIITHYYEENNRAQQIAEGFNDEEKNIGKFFDALNMSLAEQAGYLGLNKVNKFLETTVYKSTYPKKEIALSILNESNINKFVFIVPQKDLEFLKNYLKGLENYKFTVIHPCGESIEIKKYEGD